MLWTTILHNASNLFQTYEISFHHNQKAFHYSLVRSYIPETPNFLQLKITRRTKQSAFKLGRKFGFSSFPQDKVSSASS